MLSGSEGSLSGMWYLSRPSESSAKSITDGAREDWDVSGAGRGAVWGLRRRLWGLTR